MSNFSDIADLELRLNAVGLSIRLTRTGDAADIERGPFPVAIDQAALLQLGNDPEGYGNALRDALFYDPGALTAFTEARAAALDAGRRLRVRLIVSQELQKLHWETLIDPRSGRHLALEGDLLLSRYLSADDYQPVHLRQRAELRALIAIAAGADLPHYSLAPILASAEADPIIEALTEMNSTQIFATWEHLTESLRSGVDILYLVAHGALTDTGPVLYLVGDDGNTIPLNGTRLVDLLRSLGERRPRLVVLASCESAGNSFADALAALGPQIVRAGVPAVLAMQGKISMQTNARFQAVFFTELLRDGFADRAVAEARREIHGKPDWWVPVLYTRLREGRTWTVMRSNESEVRNEVDTFSEKEYELLRNYRFQVRDRMEFLRPLGITQPRDIQDTPVVHNIALEAVYIQIRAMQEQDMRERRRKEQADLEKEISAIGARYESELNTQRVFRKLNEHLQVQYQRSQNMAASNPVNPYDALNHHHRIVVLGEPGYGKSTLLHYVARRAASDPSGPIPIVVQLRDFTANLATNPSLRLDEFALRQAAGNNLELYHLLYRAHDKLWLIDGLDETRNRRDQVAEYVSQLEGRLILTSRPVGYRYGTMAQLPHFEILPLTDGDVYKFVDDWFREIARLRLETIDWAVRQKEWFRQQLTNRPQFKQFARNPLLLTFLLIIASQKNRRDLPTQRAELYRQYIEELYEPRESERNPKVGFDGEPYIRIGDLTGRDARKAILEGFYQIGHYLHFALNSQYLETSPTKSTIERFLSDSLQTFVRSRDMTSVAQDVIQFWHEAGIIDEREIDREKYIIFRHLTFQEYAVSQGLKRIFDESNHKGWAIIKNCLNLPSWHEPILLLGATLSRSQSIYFIDQLLARRSIHEKFLHRNLYLAGQMVSEGARPTSDQFMKIVQLLEKDIKRQTLLRYGQRFLLYALVILFTIFCLPWIQGPVLSTSGQALIQICSYYSVQCAFLSLNTLGILYTSLVIALNVLLIVKWEYQFRGIHLLRERWLVYSGRSQAIRVLANLIGSHVREQPISNNSPFDPIIKTHTIINALRRGELIATQDPFEIVGAIGSSITPILKAIVNQPYKTFGLDLTTPPKEAVTSTFNSPGSFLHFAIDTAYHMVLGWHIQRDNRIFVIKMLTYTGDEQAKAILQDLCNHQYWYIRVAAIEALTQLNSDGEYAAIVDRLSDPVSVVRQAAVRAIGALNIDRGAELLIPLIQDSNSEVMLTAIESLGKLRSPVAIPAIMRTLSGADHTLNYTAREALYNIGAPATLPFIQLVEQGLVSDSKLDIWRLELSPHTNTVEVARKLVQSENASLRILGIRILSQLDPTEQAEGIDILRNLLEDKDLSVAKIAADTLWKVQPPTETALEYLFSIAETTGKILCLRTLFQLYPTTARRLCANAIRTNTTTIGIQATRLLLEYTNSWEEDEELILYVLQYYGAVAIEYLNQLTNLVIPEATTKLLTLIHHENPWTRMIALKLLSLVAPEQALPLAGLMLAGHPNRWLRVMVQILVILQVVDTIPILAKYTLNYKKQLPPKLHKYLEQIAVFEHLNKKLQREYLSDENPAVQQMAISIIAYHKWQPGAWALREAIGFNTASFLNASFDVRGEAIQALASVPTNWTVPLLKKIIKAAPYDSFSAMTATQTLITIGDSSATSVLSTALEGSTRPLLDTLCEALRESVPYVQDKKMLNRLDLKIRRMLYTQKVYPWPLCAVFEQLATQRESIRVQPSKQTSLTYPPSELRLPK